MKPSQAKEYLPIIQAMAEGKTVQIKRKNESVRAYYDWTDVTQAFGSLFEGGDAERFEYRIKPEPKLRAWTESEAPVGALLKYKPTGAIGIILAKNSDGVCVPSKFVVGEPRLAMRTYAEIFESHECSTDGGKTWLPCGVETAGE